MNKRQAQRMAGHLLFLKGVPRRGFQMTRFYDPKPGSPVTPESQDASCGTSACVAGWLPVFDSKRWCVDCVFGRPMLRRNSCCKSGDGLYVEDFGEPVYVDVAKYFGISFDEASRICDPDSYNSQVPRKQTVLLRMVAVAKAHGWDISSGAATKLQE